jgi:NTE family protein
VLRLLDPSITAAGVLRAEKILDAVRDILGEVTIEELPIPYTAVSTDLLSGKSVWLQRGPVDAAIRASTEWLSRMWRSTTALFESNRAVAPPDETASAVELVEPSNGEAVPTLGSFEVMNRTIDIAQAALARHTLAAYPPDVLVEVPRSACRSLEFHRAAEVIDVGRELAATVLDELEKPTLES